MAKKKTATKKAATSAPPPRVRTGLRKPLNYLKMWDDPDWSKHLTERLHVGIVDEELPWGKEGGRKSWYLALTQTPDLFTTLGPVRGAPSDGKTLLLFEDDVVALVQHLIEGLLVDYVGGSVVNGPEADDTDFFARRAEQAARAKKSRKGAR